MIWSSGSLVWYPKQGYWLNVTWLGYFGLATWISNSIHCLCWCHSVFLFGLNPVETEGLLNGSELKCHTFAVWVNWSFIWCLKSNSVWTEIPGPRAKQRSCLGLKTWYWWWAWCYIVFVFRLQYIYPNMGIHHNSLLLVFDCNLY